MDKHKESVDISNNIAFIYQDKFICLNLYDYTYDFISNAIGKLKAELLKMGCGPGNITKYLLSQSTDFRIFRIDNAASITEHALSNNQTAQFTVRNSRQINVLNGKCDGVVPGFCLPYLSDTESVKLVKNSYNLLYENESMYLSFIYGDPEKFNYKVSPGGRVFFHYLKSDDLK